MKIVCVGDCGIDHYLPSGERFFGGISANFARHAGREFCEEDTVHLISVVGDDDDSRIVLSSLADTDIDCHISQLAGATPVQYIEVATDGERHFVRYEEGVLRDFRLQAHDRRLIADSDVLVAPVYLQIVGLFDDLMSIDTKGVICVDFADFLQHPDFDLLGRHRDDIDIAFFGLSSADQNMIAEIRKRAASYGSLFVVTLGAEGSIAFHNDLQFDCVAVSVAEVIDTTGAGDAFAAGFLSRYCHGQSVAVSLSAGAMLAAQTIQMHGAGTATTE